MSTSNSMPSAVGSPVGQRFGRLLVVEVHPAKIASRSVCICRCDCGCVTKGREDHLRSGAKRSCGCLQREAVSVANKTHGHTSNGKRSSEFSTWTGMLTRCYNPNEKRWSRYGGRGIRVCDRWRESFEAFYADMGPKPSPKHSIDRIDNDGNYEPGNCRWATQREQVRNSTRCVLVTFGGETMSLTEWAERVGAKPKTLAWRYRAGFTPEEIINGRMRKE
jgi:hypothetical protein